MDVSEKELARRQAIRNAVRRMKDGDAFIYAVTWGDCSQVKIGCTINVETRMKTLRVDYYFREPPQLIGCMRGSLFLEKQIHRALRRHFNKRAVGTLTEIYPIEAMLHPVIPEELRSAA